ncbi:hypothetical protein [Teredinibacter turnerae]|uniref:hypothetical protein n=1 Tax=Teredinibacter turnerae TaxID=2426 RepID=UPI0030D109B5
MLTISSVAPAVDESRLWLPLKYQKYYLQLKTEAERAELSDRCVKVIRGELNFSKSTPSNPVFSIICRDQAGKSYNIAGVEPPVPKEVFWEKCKDTFENETRLMRAMNVLTEMPPVAQRLTEDRTLYIVDFDAKDIAGVALKYRAKCIVEKDTIRFFIRARKASD